MKVLRGSKDRDEPNLHLVIEINTQKGKKLRKACTHPKLVKEAKGSVFDLWPQKAFKLTDRTGDWKEPAMQPLVVFYSRTGTTKQVAEALAQTLNCDSEELVDTKKRGGPMGFVRSGMDARAKNLTTLADIKHDPASYDLVILGTPIWGGTLSSAMRTYITNNRSKFKRVAFFCTQGGTENQALFDEMEALCEKHPANILALQEKEVKKGAYQEKIRHFADGLSTP